MRIASSCVTIGMFLVATLTHIPSRASTLDFSNFQVDQRGVKVKQKEVWPVSESRWALIVGIDQYDDANIKPLDGAVNDAKKLATTLHQVARFPANQVISLTSDQPREMQPTRGNILLQMARITSLMPQSGLLVAAFSGHGIERDGQMFLLPSDAQTGPSPEPKLLEQTAIGTRQVREWIYSKAKQILIILDTCRSDPWSSSSTQASIAFDNLVDALSMRKYSHGLHIDASRPTARAEEAAMTNKDVINWVKLGGSEGAIIELINETKVKQFDVSRDEKASAHPTQELRDYYKRARNSFEEKWYRGSKNRVVN